MKVPSRLLGFFALLLPAAAIRVAAQEHPARRVANIVSVAVEEYGKAVNAQGKLISEQEYQEANDFLVDAARSAERLSGDKAPAARALIDSLATAVRAKRPPSAIDSLSRRFADILGNEARLELPKRKMDIALGKATYDASCASCHGALGLGDGPAAGGMNPPPPALGRAADVRRASPALMFRVISVGMAGTPMPAFAATLTADQRWNVVAYITSLRATHAQQLEGEGLFTQKCASCHGVEGASDGALARSLTKLPPEIGTITWQAERSDEQIMLASKVGMPGTAMPPSHELSDAQLASLVSYVRTLPMKERNANAVAAANDSTSPAGAAKRVLALLEQSLSAAKGGRNDDAGDKAFDAYIAFEPLETPARAKKPGLVSSMERQFAEFKAAVRASDVRAAEGLRNAIESSLPEIVALTAPTGSGIKAFWQSFLIIFREGLEAILVVGAIVAFLIKTGHRNRLKSIWLGVGYALAASAVTAVVLKTILAELPATREIIEGATMLVAVAVLFSVSFWLISKVEAAKWQAFIKDKVGTALEQGGGRALTFVVFLAVYREGAETALFYQALFNEGPHVIVPLSLGILAGSIVLAVIFTLFYRFGVRIPLRPFFTVTSVLLYYMAFVFLGKGIRELQEGDAIGLSVISGFPHIEWLGIFPSWQGVLAQLVLLLMFVFMVLKTLWPKRSVTLPTMMPATPAAVPVPVPVPVLDQQLASIRAENTELRERLAALEEAMERAPAQ